ncbi:MAG: gamma-glutamyltransferase [Vicinamibacterales bacterium]
MRRALAVVAGAASCLTLALAAQVPSPGASGVQDPAWSRDGKQLASSFLDRIWISAPNGRRGRLLRSESAGVERDPAWSPDGKWIAFAVDTGEGFDIYVAAPDGKNIRKLTSTPGDERWPSWTADDRIVFSSRDAALSPWRLFSVKSAGAEAVALFGDAQSDSEFDAEVSPDGERIAYISDRDSEDGDLDLWVAELQPDARGRTQRTRLTRLRGVESSPSWAPDSGRIAYFAAREGLGSVWVDVAQPSRSANAPEDPRVQPMRPRPATQPVLVSRHGGAPAWSPDGKRLVIASAPPLDPSYNGNPLRNRDEPPPLFATDAFRLWTVDAPLAVDAGAQQVAIGTPNSSQLVGAFERVFNTLQRLYYMSGSSAEIWVRLHDKYIFEATQARDEAQLETVIDRLVAEQPLIKPAVTSNKAVVVSGNPLASQAGVLALEKGGNIVDAAIAASFALGVVEPDASGIGGDGMAVLYLKGMKEPVVIDYKDQVPIHATAENPLLRASTGDGPAAANIPGVVAGLDYLYKNYGSKKVAWSELIAPAIGYAEDGYILDQALPTSIVEGRRFFQKYAAAKAIYMPAGKLPKPGDRFINQDYAATLRAISSGGAQAFYRGEVARKIAADMAKNGGLITLDDLAQYRAIERRPLSGRYRDHVVFSASPPVSTGQALIETLQILENYQPNAGATYTNDADYLHYALEAWKVRDQSPRIADPALFDVNLGNHLDPAHAAELFKRIDPKVASRGRQDPATGSEPPPERIGRGTTAFAVADADGNMIAITQTLSTWGGTFYVSEGLGFLYNNHLRFGGVGAPGRFLPLARSSSTSVPTLVFRKSDDVASPGIPRLTTAAAGNAWITASVYEIILNVIDSGMSAQRAIEAPRFLIGRDPLETDVSRTQIEDRLPRAILQNLMARGHRFEKIGRKGEVRYGYAAAIVVDPAAREVQGGAEPRRSHGSAVPR